MGTIPKEFLPPEKYLPKKVYREPWLQYPEKLSIMRSFYEDVVKDWDKVAIYYKDDKVTFSELRNKVNKVANALKGLGVERDDRVMLRSPNIPEFIYALYACWTIGAIPVMVMPLLRAAELAHRGNDSEAKIMIVSSDAFMDVDRAIPQIKTLENVITIGERMEGCLFWDDIVNDQPTECEIADTNRDDLARFLYSSGTTGVPKGAIGHVVDMCVLGDVHGKYMLHLKEDDVVGGHPVFTFAMGGVFPLYLARVGCSLSVVKSPTLEDMFETVEKHRITVLLCVPSFFKSMLRVEDAEKRYDLSSLRLCQSAGEWLPGSTRLEWKRRFGVDIVDHLGSGDGGYWMGMPEGAPDDKSDATGFPAAGFECKVVDGNFNEVPVGQDGELIFRGPDGQEYWRRPEKQMEGVHDGWSRPGLIYMKDKDGYFWYKGRTDDMIVSSGYKIPGGEVENVLLSHEAVFEAAVVASPDPGRGYVVKAFVVLNEEYEPSDELAKKLQGFVKANLEPYKYPRKIEFVDGAKLPRTSTGKIQRRVLRDMEEKGEKLK